MPTQLQFILFSRVPNVSAGLAVAVAIGLLLLCWSIEAEAEVDVEGTKGDGGELN